jgi:CRISPR/Cas system CSM-associated protein Csm4 (group 5 of RAMP superfamily)
MNIINNGVNLKRKKSKKEQFLRIKKKTQLRENKRVEENEGEKLTTLKMEVKSMRGRDLRERS